MKVLFESIRLTKLRYRSERYYPGHGRKFDKVKLKKTVIENS